MMIGENFDKNNLHHAYLIEGKREEVMPEIVDLLADLDVDIVHSPDFYNISVDSFKIEDARNLRSFAMEKGFSTAKKIFIISANNFLLEAQNSLLKMFEEPIENTHFFLIVPDANSLLKTLASRFYLIKSKPQPENEVKSAEKFIAMPLRSRIDFIKELLAEPENEEGEESGTIILDSTRSKALKFLNALEFSLHKKLIFKGQLDVNCFAHLFRVREFLRMPGSSPKTLMESVALVTPTF